MKYLFIVNLLLIFSTFFASSTYATTPSKQELLTYWEEFQKNNKELKAFSKVDENTYSIAFENIPFEGNIEVISVSIDELFYENTLPINYVGIIEVKLPEELKSLEESYSRSFNRWKDSTYFYYNDELKSWLTSKEYDKLSNKVYQTLEPTEFTKLMKQYSGEVILGLIILFLILTTIQLTFLWKIKQTMVRKD